MDILGNLQDAFMNTPEFLFLVLSNILLLAIVLYMAFTKPDKRLRLFAAVLMMFGLFITVPIFFNMFFK